MSASKRLITCRAAALPMSSSPVVLAHDENADTRSTRSFSARITSKRFDPFAEPLPFLP